MKKLFFVFFGLLFCISIIAQNQEVPKQSLMFLNKTLNLHLEKVGKVILVDFEGTTYISCQFVMIEALQELTSCNYKYAVKKVGENKYEYVLSISSRYKGTFEAIESNGKYEFSKLDYIHISDY